MGPQTGGSMGVQSCDMGGEPETRSGSQRRVRDGGTRGEPAEQKKPEPCCSHYVDPKKAGILDRSPVLGSLALLLGVGGMMTLAGFLMSMALEKPNTTISIQMLIASGLLFACFFFLTNGLPYRLVYARDIQGIVHIHKRLPNWRTDGTCYVTDDNTGQLVEFGMGTLLSKQISGWFARSVMDTGIQVDGRTTWSWRASTKKVEWNQIRISSGNNDANVACVGTPEEMLEIIEAFPLGVSDEMWLLMSCGDNTRRQNDQFTLASQSIVQYVQHLEHQGEFLTDVLDVAYARIRASKDTMGKSEHAELIGNFIGAARERLKHAMEQTTWPAELAGPQRQLFENLWDEKDKAIQERKTRKSSRA